MIRCISFLTVPCIFWACLPIVALAQEKEDPVAAAFGGKWTSKDFKVATPEEADKIRSGPVRGVFEELGLKPGEYRILTAEEAMKIRGGPVSRWPNQYDAVRRHLYMSPPRSLFIAPSFRRR